MSITIGKYTFDGPYVTTERLEDRSGVYAIICQRGDENYLTRVETHDRSDCWKKNCQGRLAVAVYYTPYMQQSERMAIEQEIRKQYNPPCGER